MSNGSVLSKVFDIYQHASDQVRMADSERHHHSSRLASNASDE
jgi:hypothetical protein